MSEQIRGQESPNRTMRKMILDAGVALFSRFGFHGVGVRSIAEAVGLTPSTLYHYVEGKDQLLYELMVDGLERLSLSTSRVRDLAEDPLEALALQTIAHTMFHLDEPYLALVVDTEIRSLTGSARESILEMRDAYEQTWAEILQIGTLEDVFRVPNEKLARLSILSLCNGAAHWYKRGGEWSEVVICRGIARLVLQTVGVNPKQAAQVSEIAISKYQAIIPKGHMEGSR